MDEVQIFKNDEFGEIRTILVNNEPYFVGKDVATVLGYTNPQKAIRDHVDKDDKTQNESFTVNGTQVVLINESGLYSLILSSKLPTAKKFKKWVTSEVLPAIRKTGSYAINGDTTDTANILPTDKLWERAIKHIKAAQNDLNWMNEQIGQAQGALELRKKVLENYDDMIYAQVVLKSSTTWNTNVIAKEFGLSAKTLNKKLEALGIQYKQHGVWLLTADYQGKGYTKTQTYNYLNKDQETCTRLQTEWTEKGRRFLHELHDKKKF